MDDDDAAELARLRERAYGRSADIAGDAAAVARLRELEAREAERPAEGPPAEDAADAPETAPAAETTAPDVDPERPYGAPRRWPRWATNLGLVASAAALVAGTVAITLSIPREAPRYPDAEQVATLTQLEAWPPESDSNSRRYADFRGFSVFATVVGTPADPNPVRCLSIVSPQEAAQPEVGETLSTCGAGPFPVAVTAVVSDLSPEAAKDAYALGTAINFTLGESGVEVWVAAR
ncbi:hypothetical protein QE428_000787 [Microbacterium sp. SORGH_AS 505]|uniref:hypothetical protein n=1 Tax=Microbacterium sp. SORGH_AS_0505 TaxID=3041770 RepID=UPI00278893C8|nr:hypothetical protein [Microbacterium sp. SORGH_AS_0505]MDQ1125754.1 hypothetical protein [Microbacterium sp. SORGH_AS_0505]